MSVIVRGLKIPKSCAECQFLEVYNRPPDYDDEFMCEITYQSMSYEEYKTRYANCPLVEVQPHGDLIDRSKLYEKTAEWEAQALHIVETTMNDEDTTEWRKWSTILTERSAFKFDVADAPTIIEAEE